MSTSADPRIVDHVEKDLAEVSRARASHHGTVLAMSRRSAETMLRDVVDRATGQSHAASSLRQLEQACRSLRKKKDLADVMPPFSVLVHVQTVMHLGNSGVHGRSREDEETEATSAMLALVHVARWYARTHLEGAGRQRIEQAVDEVYAAVRVRVPRSRWKWAAPGAGLVALYAASANRVPRARWKRAVLGGAVVLAVAVLTNLVLVTTTGRGLLPPRETAAHDAPRAMHDDPGPIRTFLRLAPFVGQ